MGSPITLGLLAGGLSAMSSVAKTQAENRQARYQADVAAGQAQAARNQARMAGEEGRIEQENLNRERSVLSRRYRVMQAGNAVDFSARGVDMSSGSAADVLTGNAMLYARDVGLNGYQKTLHQWQTRQNVNAALASAANYDAHASYYRTMVRGLGETVLTAGLSGLTGGLSAYAKAGGTFSGHRVAGAGVSTRRSLAHPDNLIPNYNKLYR